MDRIHTASFLNNAYLQAAKKGVESDYSKEETAMVLVDRDIARMVESNSLIENFDANCLTNIGYDLRTEYFAVNQKEERSATLKPGESVFVASKEAVRLPDNLLGRVYLKNSRIRQGLSLESPVYQPGHFTKVFFRLRNVSNGEIKLTEGQKYAMIVFEQLSRKPDEPYHGTFQSEIDFKGLADYTEIYKEQVDEIEKKTEDLKNMEHSIYANVLVILTVFVALFSFLTTNIGLFSRESSSAEFVLYNLIMLGGISFLVAVLNSTIGTNKFAKRAIWAATTVFFVAAFFLLWKMKIIA